MSSAYLCIDRIVIGHEKEIHYQKEVGDLDFKWLRQYGTAWRVKGCMGVIHVCWFTAVFMLMRAKFSGRYTHGG